ncbi:MAG: PQ-loop domain-containing transporter [Duncaniella sp.]|nr:PQ-loop domain-containing transporter [Duncaniella sp.]HBI58690.1 hypothetical protein [Porphyromonadaceae bacterium]
MSPLLINIVGYAAAVCMVCGYLPQAIYTIRTRDTDGIAMPTFLLLGFGSIFFVIQGLMLGNWPLIITNLITTVSSIIVFIIKVQNDYFKKKK